MVGHGCLLSSNDLHLLVGFQQSLLKYAHDSVTITRRMFLSITSLLCNFIDDKINSIGSLGGFLASR
jgi:hypothetical protein